MYTIGDTVYASPGYVLRGYNKIGYQLCGSESDFTEEVVNIDDAIKTGSIVKYNNGLMRVPVNSNTTYGELKSKFIKMRYSYDDQIAIILNKDDSDEDRQKYTRMQEWRE
jgi:hypothetical protein